MSRGLGIPLSGGVPGLPVRAGAAWEGSLEPKKKGIPCGIPRAVNDYGKFSSTHLAALRTTSP